MSSRIVLSVVVVLVVGACKREKAEHKREPGLVVDQPPLPPGPRPRRKTTPHCALTGQRPSATRQKPSATLNDWEVRMMGREDPLVGILADTNPVVIDGYPGTLQLSTPLTGVEVGDIVKTSVVLLDDTSGPEIGQRHVARALEPAIGEADRVGTVITYWVYAHKPLAILDDGTVTSDGKPALKLADDELAALMRAFGAAKVDKLASNPQGVSKIVNNEIRGGSITLSCARVQTIPIFEPPPAMANVIVKLDAIVATIEKGSTYRVQYREYQEIEWIDWNEAVTITELVANQHDQEGWRDRDRVRADYVVSYDAHRKLATNSSGRVFVREAGKVYSVQSPRRLGNEGGYNSMRRISLLTATECLPAGKAPCHVWSPVDVPFSTAQSGVALSRDVIEGLGLEIRDDIDKTPNQTLAIVGNYVFSGLTVWRDPPVAQTWYINYHEQLPIHDWPATAPALATLRAEHDDVALHSRARTDMPSHPMYARVPDALGQKIVEPFGLFEDRGVVYSVSSQCTDPACGVGTFFALRANPFVVRAWPAMELSLASLTAKVDTALTPEQFAANQRLLESYVDNRGEWREGKFVYRYVVVTRR